MKNETKHTSVKKRNCNSSLKHFDKWILHEVSIDHTYQNDGKDERVMHNDRYSIFQFNLFFFASGSSPPSVASGAQIGLGWVLEYAGETQ